MTAPLPPDQPAGVTFMPDEQPLYTVDASNLAQYADMLPEGNQLLISKFGNSIKVYKTCRSHAVPKYVAYNIAKNVTRAQFVTAGGRFGFTGAYGGIPFPIIDTSGPYAAGAQLIWNYLCAWPGDRTLCSRPALTSLVLRQTAADTCGDKVGLEVRPSPRTRRRTPAGWRTGGLSRYWHIMSPAALVRVRRC